MKKATWCNPEFSKLGVENTQNDPNSVDGTDFVWSGEFTLPTSGKKFSTLLGGSSTRPYPDIKVVP